MKASENCKPAMRRVLAVLACALATTSAAWALAKPAPSLAAPLDTQLRIGFSAAQACEPEIDDDLSAYGECIGHAADRFPGQKLPLLGLNFQAWLIADLMARQSSHRAIALRQRYQKALEQGMRANGVRLGQLCAAKTLACGPIQQRMRQKIQP